MDLMEKLCQFQDGVYDSCDIAEKLVGLSGLDDNEQLYKELLESLYQLRSIAANPYNSDYWRVLYNVLLSISGKEDES